MNDIKKGDLVVTQSGEEGTIVKTFTNYKGEVNYYLIELEDERKVKFPAKFVKKRE